MSGIYLHIPFCKQACHYCNFHFSTSLKYKSQLLDAIQRELELQKDYLKGATISTIYFGGGTPSLLSREELNSIFNKIYQLHPVDEKAEITLEANPDDLSLEKLQALKDTPINRLSIGLQSFSEEDLRYMNRAHSAEESITCIEHALKMGFENLTVDLIYGSPTTSDAQWQTNMDTVFEFNIPHISCYALTVEPGTALAHFVKTKKSKPVDEEQAARQFEMLIQASEAQGYIHYEISNFSKEGHYSQHNSSYWLGKSYLGIGPSAHSFNGHSRQWNVAHNQKYLRALAEDKVPFEKEILSPDQQYNEYILTSLRTIWGVSLEKLEQIGAVYKDYFIKNIQSFIDSGHVKRQEDAYILTSSGKLLADGIASDLFYLE